MTELPSVTRTRRAPDLRQKLASPVVLRAAAGEFQVENFLLEEGFSRNVELLVVDSGAARVAICPTRGMSLWRAHISGVDCGWNSPVQGPVHPSLVPTQESSGIGWLSGFDELLVRCGLRSFGAPDFDDHGKLLFPLHGQVGNLPARNLQLELDADQSLLRVTGEVHETRFLQYNLHLSVEYTFAFGKPTIGIRDRLTNASVTPTTAQMLYHINIGEPLLQSKMTAHITAKRGVARDAHASKNRDQWQTYLAPTAGYAEQVYFFECAADSSGWSGAMLTTPDAARAFSVRHKTATLPYLSQWKNTVAVEDGYVTGLEPGTGFPNPRSFEQEHGRVVELAGGESMDFELELECLTDPTQIAQRTQELAKLNAPLLPIEDFDATWCMPRN